MSGYRRSILFIFFTLFITAGTSVIANNNAEFVFDFETYIENPVIPTGEAGEWDAGGLYGPSVVEYDAKLYLFYTGVRSQSSFDVAIGFASSDDGFHWEKYEGNPILGGSIEGPRLVDIAAVTVTDEGVWTMYFDIPSRGLPNALIYRATAPAPEGPWEVSEAPMIRGSASWNRQIFPSGIIKTDSEHLLYFGALDNPTASWGVAMSEDGERWEILPDPILAPTPESWDSRAITPSNVLATDDGWETFYIGYDRNVLQAPRQGASPLQLGYATSTDGIQWMKHPTPIFETDQTGFPLMSTIRIDETYLIYYDDEFGREGLGLMFGTIDKVND